MVEKINAKTLKTMISDGEELAVLDVREEGEFGSGHILYAVPLPYSILEMRLGQLVPHPTTRTVLVDGGNGVGERAANRMNMLGYSRVAILEDGMTAWIEAGYEAFMGVNVPCKAFGEVVEQTAHTPSISPEELHAMQSRGEKVVVLDGRSPAEFNRMNIPGGVSVPNAELVYRVHDFTPDQKNNRGYQLCRPDPFHYRRPDPYQRRPTEQSGRPSRRYDGMALGRLST